jgi:hypothetical protein
MHSNTVIPLKYLCVDAVYDSLPARKNDEDEDGEHIEFDWDKQLKTYPEEIRSLFPRKELWRWALFLKDEKKQDLILRLYQAVNRRIKDPKDKNKIELVYGGVKFCVSKHEDGTKRNLWLGDLNSVTLSPIF